MLDLSSNGRHGTVDAFSENGAVQGVFFGLVLNGVSDDVSDIAV
jgi:hypothetical protein